MTLLLVGVATTVFVVTSFNYPDLITEDHRCTLTTTPSVYKVHTLLRTLR